MVRTELVLSAILIILLAALANPFGLIMLNSAQMTVLICLVLLFGAYATFLFRESIRDERESLHRHIAARFAYLSGSVVLIIGITLQTLSHTLDLWLVAAVVAMILGKIIGLIYSRRTH